MLKWLCGLVAAALALAPASAVPASKFYQSIGVNWHPWYVNPIAYKRLVELGVPNVRGKIGTNRTAVTNLQPFFQAGGKLNATIIASKDGTLDKADAKRNLDFLKNTVGLSHVSGIEGPNEFNINHTAGWATQEREFVQWLHDTVRADAAYNSVPIIAPSVWKRILADYQALGDLSAWVDKGCIHYYSGNRRPTLTGAPSFTMQGSLQAANQLAPGKPIWMTETGWQSPAGNQPISLRAQAKYVLRDYFDAFGYGVEKTFMYQLQDDQTNLFGLTDPNGNPKLSFTALKNLIELVKDTQPSSGQIGYSFTNAPSSLKSIELSKSDGTFLIAFYLDVDSYDVRNRRDIESNVPVTLNVSGKIEVYQPTFNSSPITTSSGSSFPLFASDQLTVVKVTP